MRYCGEFIFGGRVAVMWKMLEGGRAVANPVFSRTVWPTEKRCEAVSRRTGRMLGYW